MSYQGAHSGAEVDDAVGAGKGTGNGVMVKSGTGAGVRRTITGSTRVDVTNGDGTAGNPTLDLTQTAIDSLALADTSIQPGDPLAVPHTVVSASRSLALTDANDELQVDAAATLTVDADATTSFPRGDKISVLSITTGTVTIDAVAGVTINGVSGGSANLTAQYSAAVLTKLGADAWALNGDHGGVS